MEVIDEMGMATFVAMIDHQIKSGETIEWDDPDREGVTPPVTEEVDIDTRLNHFVRVKLPNE
eukprot:587694-Amphidinium_carterae.1